jgi:hypothetical protein
MSDLSAAEKQYKQAKKRLHQEEANFALDFSLDKSGVEEVLSIRDISSRNRSSGVCRNQGNGPRLVISRWSGRIETLCLPDEVGEPSAGLD